MISLFLVALFVLPHSTVSSSVFGSEPAKSFCSFTHLHPRRYGAYHLQDERIVIDGLLDEKAWAEVPWSEAFQDIQGPQSWPQPWFTTKIKLRYDDQFLYVGAYLEETAVWANVSKRNDVIFHDNDFEVFVDPDGNTHNYKEFEVNARNTTWNLWLNRPYRDGGHENSSRVDPEHGFDMLGSGMRSAVYFNGRLGDPAERMHYWTVEIALPLSQLALHTKAAVPPAGNSFWRINFSRVEWPIRVAMDPHTGEQHYVKEAGLKEENWVWSAQYAIAMHRPEWWGYLQFRPRDEKPVPANEIVVPLDREWGVRYVAYQFYYAQHAFQNATGRFASSLNDLRPLFSSRRALKCTELHGIINATKSSFRAQIKLTDYTGLVATIQDDGYIVVGSTLSVAEE